MFKTSVDGMILGIIPCLNSVCGNLFFRRCSISSDRGAAPVENRRKQDKSYSSTSGSRTSLMRIGGTRSNSLSWCFTTVSSRSFIVNAGSMYTSALIEMGRWRAWTRPVTGGLDYQLEQIHGLYLKKDKESLITYCERQEARPGSSVDRVV